MAFVNHDILPVKLAQVFAILENDFVGGDNDGEVSIFFQSANKVGEKKNERKKM
jgi:hypothetical protein